MDMCPLCNGLEMRVIECPNCQTIMEDRGKITDYLDDYSAYMDIDIMKLFDGTTNSLENHRCIHYFYCRGCQHEDTRAIKE